MSTNDPLKNWQLENSGQNPDQWKLEDSEQDLNKHMQLEPAETNPYWQPVEYERDPKPRRRNWVLPSILIVALLGVLGYVGWIAFSQFNSGGGLTLPGVGELIPGDQATPAASPAAEGAAVAAAETPTAASATPTTAPTATATPEVAPTATPEPAPAVAVAQLITGTVNSVAGVNARAEPATTGALIRLLNENEVVTVVQEQGDWLQVILPDNTTAAWASAEFITASAPQAVPYAQAVALYTAAGLPPPPQTTGTLPAATTPTTATTATTEVAPVAPLTLDVVVSTDPGINARATPSTDGTIVDRLTISTTVTAIGRTLAGDWLAVRLPSGQGGWVVANLVTAAGDATTLPVLEPIAIAPASTVTTTAEITGTTSITATGVPTTTPGGATVVPATPPLTTGEARLTPNGALPTAPFTNTLPAIGPALTVSDTTGINARPNPNTEGDPLLVVPNGSVLSIVGRNAAGDWYQVRLPDGRLAWMRADLISASSDAATAPVVDTTAPAATAPVTTTETTTTTPAAPSGPTLVATIDRDLGANFRSAPNRDLDPVYNAQKGESFTVVGRTNASDWVQVVLPDGSFAWALAGTVVLDGDIATLAVTQP